MVRTLVTVLLLAAALPTPAAALYRAEPDSVALGEPITLTITARPDKLQNLDLAPLMKDFEVRDQSLGGDGREASLSLTLYPLRSGRIALPDFGLRLRTPAVTVSEQSETVPRVRFLSEVDPAQYHVREPLRLSLQACDDGSLIWQRPRLATQEGLLVRPLGEEQFEVEREGERCTAHRWHWALQSTAAGEIVLPLPMLEASKFGRQLRFPPPQLRLNALPVPDWLPAEAAVGKPEISAAPLPREWPIESPLAVRLEVRGGYGAEALKHLLRLQLAHLPQFSDYPPQVEELASDDGVPRHAVSLYALFRERGAAQWPDLLLPWYDPAGGRLRQTQIKGAKLEIVDPARQRLLAWLSASGGLLAAMLSACFLWRWLGWRVRRRRALSELKQVTELPELVRGLCAFSLRRKARPAATLGEWRQRMQRETLTQGLEELVASVEAAHYGRQETALAGLLEIALARLSTARPKSFTFSA